MSDGLGQFLPITAGNPTQSRHLTTKAYVDAAILNLVPDIICKAATSSNVIIGTELENGDSVDGIILFAGDYILVKDQEDKTENGIYIINTVVGDSTRTPQRLDYSELSAETLVYIEHGDNNIGKIFSLINPTEGFSGEGDHPSYGDDELIFTEIVNNLPRNINELIDVKEAVVAASVNNVNLSFPGTHLDCVELITGNRIFLKDQNDKNENGIYIFDTHCTSLTRSLDADENGEIISGMYVFVLQGNTNQHTGWILTTANPINVDTTELVFNNFNGVPLPQNINDINNMIPSDGSIIRGDNSGHWVIDNPGSSSGVQAWDADLDTIADLSHTSGNVIRSNGTVWQSTTVSLDDLSDAIITSPVTNNILIYNGTNWVNGTSPNLVKQVLAGSIGVTSGNSHLTNTQTATTSSGTQIWSQAITTSNNSSKVEVNMSINFDASNSTRYISLILIRDSTVIGVYGQFVQVAGNPNTLTISHMDSISTTGTTHTYSARFASSRENWYVGRDSGNNTYGGKTGSSYSLKEIV